MAKKKKPQTRFTLIIGKERRQLFKIHDRGGDLIISLSHARYYTNPPFEGREILERRYSVHPSLHSDLSINEIKQTIRLEGDVLIETVLSSFGPKSGGLQMIFCRACPDLRFEGYDVPEGRARDKIVSTGRYNPERQTFLFAVFVGELGGPSKLTGSLHFEQTSVAFQNYRIIVAWATVGLSSSCQGKLRHQMTHHIRVNHAVPRGTINGPTTGMDEREAKAFLLNEFSALGEIVGAFAAEAGFEKLAVDLENLEWRFGRNHNLTSGRRRKLARTGRFRRQTWKRTI